MCKLCHFQLEEESSRVKGKAPCCLAVAGALCEGGCLVSQGDLCVLVRVLIWAMGAFDRLYREFGGSAACCQPSDTPLAFTILSTPTPTRTSSGPGPSLAQAWLGVGTRGQQLNQLISLKTEVIAQISSKYFFYLFIGMRSYREERERMTDLPSTNLLHRGPQQPGLCQAGARNQELRGLLPLRGQGPLGASLLLSQAH